MHTDFLVIGSGLAGLNYVLNVGRLNPDKQITVVTKANPEESNTKYAQGGVAIVHDQSDSFSKHIDDTLIAGDGLCDEEIVDLVVKSGPDCLNEFINIGVEFDLNTKGELDLGKEGGHSENRVVHFQDITGFAIEKSLINQVKQLTNVTLLDHHFAIDLITEHHSPVHHDGPTTCYGAFVLNEKTNEIVKINARITYLATGGIGHVYSHTTNPKVATGDGIAMAYRAKALIKDIEFVQFHPTALYEPSTSPSFLVSEAVRGFGAKLRLMNGESFMENYDPREELASRDIVARAIDNELKKHGEKYVYLDCTHLDADSFNKHFPNIVQRCLKIGIDPSKDWIPVVPAQHYLCGGIETDKWGATSVQNLFAGGECARTGLHGANRLASNSLLEAFVFSKRSALKSSELVSNIEINTLTNEWDSKGTTRPKEHILISQNRDEVQSIMWNYVGIVRTNERLQRARERLNLLYLETEELYKRSTLSPQLCELRNLITIAHLIVSHSMKRTENRGGYYNVDLENNSTS